MDIKNGTITTYWKRTKRLKSEYNYSSGLLNGLAKFYTSDGWLHQQILYKDDEIKSSTLYYPNGKVKLLENFNGLERHGLSQCFDNKGNLIIQDKYVDNRLVERIVFRLTAMMF